MPLSELHRQFCDAYIRSRNIHQAVDSSGISLTTTIPKGFYVYLLIEEQTGRIFYIGKGTGRRVLDHFRQNETINPYKQKEMIDIVNRGNTVSYRILEAAIEEPDAFAIERQMIELLSSTGLTNMQKGQFTQLQRARKEAEVLLLSIMPLETWIRFGKKTRTQIKDYHLRIKELSELAYS